MAYTDDHEVWNQTIELVIRKENVISEWLEIYATSSPKCPLVCNEHYCCFFL